MSQVLYRKYRPKNFDEVHGQGHVVTTLQNQVAAGEVSHAYLFSGPRGTGKTSVARILASELGVSEIDLIEIDAASNRGIDDVRALRESVHFLPAQSLKKLYILDEVHMLTSEAFNALLKTLEEPPSHVHFVLCTTEPHRVPVTILSRCQRHNFVLGDRPSVTNYLKAIIDREDIFIEPEVLNFIAERSGGSYRDAAGLLQQVLSYASRDKVPAESFLKSLGFGLEVETEKLSKLVIQKSVEELLDEVSTLVDKGVDPSALLDNLIARLRKEVLREQPSSSSTSGVQGNDLVSLLRGLNSARAEIKVSTPPQLPIELAILEWGSGLDTVEERFLDSEDPDSKVSKNRSSRQKSKPNEGELPWAEIMARVRDLNHSLEALLKACEPRGVEDGVVTLQFKYKFHKEKIEEVNNRRLVEQAMSEVLGREVRIKCVINTDGGWRLSRAEKIGDKPVGNGDDILKVAQEIFGGEIIE